MKQRELFWALVHSRCQDFHKQSCTIAMVISEKWPFSKESLTRQAIFADRYGIIHIDMVFIHSGI
jgi:hypothetical protein